MQTAISETRSIPKSAVRRAEAHILGAFGATPELPFGKLVARIVARLERGERIQQACLSAAFRNLELAGSIVIDGLPGLAHTPVRQAGPRAEMLERRAAERRAKVAERRAGIRIQWVGGDHHAA